jgi:hypothetical protein
VEESHGTGAIFAAREATIEVIEVIDRQQAEYINEVEAGGRASGPVRLALRVSDVDGASRSLRERGARAMSVPVETPWGDRDQRLRALDGMQLTLFACD